MNSNNNVEDLICSNKFFDDTMMENTDFNQNVVHFKDTIKSRPSKKLQNDIEVAIYMRDLLVYSE